MILSSPTDAVHVMRLDDDGIIECGLHEVYEVSMRWKES